MITAALYAANVLAIGVLVFGLYFPRHRRRDLVVAYVGVNIGVMVVSSMLVSTAVAAGLGLGLFGVLSIIRLRSDELSQHEVAYYFTALALGLIGGLGTDLGISAALMAMLLAAMFVADHPRMLRGYHRQEVVLDRATGDRAALIAQLEQRLGARVVGVTVTRLDTVNDTTTVDVRYRTNARAAFAPFGQPQMETLR